MSAASKKLLCSLSADEIKAWVAAFGAPAFRAAQILDWIYKKRVIKPAAMSNLPPELRRALQDDFICASSNIETEVCAGDGTEKMLLRLSDGETVEMVIIPAPDRITFCLSTQVGCPVQCVFCASGAYGLTRNLDAGEMIEQFFHGCAKIGKLPNNVVFMGIGEGLLNFDNLAKTLQLLCDPEYVGLGARRITVSTSGFVPGMHRLADLERQVTLAVSLHTTDDAVRATLIPDKLRYPINDILDACLYYREKTGRMITFEYTLLDGINDRAEDAEKLAALAKRMHAKINLIPYNQTTEKFRRPSDKVIRNFNAILDKHDIQVTLRMEKGSAVHAACGQLRAANKSAGNS
jgi:23S rRNA (adenine2503-C2)-methyltransferase